MRTPTTRMTISLPTDLLEAVDRAVREGQARSRNQFAAMADDAVYQQETSEIAREFDAASWEALQAAEARE